MKQFITVEQLNELSKKSFNKLYNWARNKGYSSEKAIRFSLDGKPLLSIGQMIEFLSTDRKNIDLCFPNEFFINEERFETRYLCDALWKTIKEVLEKSK